MLDTFLSPLSNYNVLIVIGPTGCGKTTIIKQELEKFKDSISISYNNLNFTKVNTLSLDGRIIVKVIDPADNLEIPNIILKHQSKYILVANSLENLPEWCSSTKVMQIQIPLPKKQELLVALKFWYEEHEPQISSGYEFSEDDIPDNIQNYHQLHGFIFNSNAVLQSSNSPLITRNYDDTIDKIRDGGEDINVPIPLDRVLNRIIIYEEGIEYISLLDMFHNSGFPKDTISRVLRKIIRAAPKLVPYKGVFVPRKKKEKVEEEFEIGKLEDEVSPAKELKVEKDKTSLFDF